MPRSAEVKPLFWRFVLFFFFCLFFFLQVTTLHGGSALNGDHKVKRHEGMMIMGVAAGGTWLFLFLNIAIYFFFFSKSLSFSF